MRGLRRAIQRLQITHWDCDKRKRIKVDSDSTPVQVCTLVSRSYHPRCSCPNQRYLRIQSYTNSLHNTVQLTHWLPQFWGFSIPPKDPQSIWDIRVQILHESGLNIFLDARIQWQLFFGRCGNVRHNSRLQVLRGDDAMVIIFAIDSDALFSLRWNKIPTKDLNEVVIQNNMETVKSTSLR
jgi:hypothetical protein